jgi:putative transposase
MAGAQLQLALETKAPWGGKRDGAGRKKVKERSSVPHRSRKPHVHRHPVHITLRATREAGCLRAKRPFKAIRKAIRSANESGRIRVVHYSVQGNHIHLIVEAAGETTLSRGLQGLNIRIARAINKLLHRTGTVLAERYHRHDLATPTEVEHAIRYVLQNFRKHNAQPLPHDWIDPCSSSHELNTFTVEPPRTWLLAKGWRIA